MTNLRPTYVAQRGRTWRGCDEHGRDRGGQGALLGSKPRPVDWAERRARIEEVGAHRPPPSDVGRTAVDVDGVPGEWSCGPTSDHEQVLLYFHDGGFRSGSLLSHRGLVMEAGRAGGLRTLAVAYSSLDNAARFAARAGAAAVRVRLDVRPEMIHAFPLWSAALESSRRALADAGALMREDLG